LKAPVVRAAAALLGAAAVAACGSAGTGPRVCGTTGPGAGGLRGTVVEAQPSGRPVACARVVVEFPGQTASVYTDAAGAFETGVVPPTGSAYAVHVFPPGGSEVSALSVYDLYVLATGPVLRLELPLRRKARPPSGTVRPGVTGRVLDSSGAPQPGFAPPGERVGGPGTIGFVWWGAYGERSSGRWLDSGVTDDAGNFDVWTAASDLPDTRPLFVGNYTGRSPERDVVFYRQYAVAPSAPAGSAWVLRMAPVTGEAVVLYDTAARDVLRGLGTNGVSVVYVSARPAGPFADLELARAYTGPLVGTLAVRQAVPVPAELVRPSGAFAGLVGLGYAYDASVLDGTGELSVTLAPAVDGLVSMSYLRAPGRFAWEAGRGRFSWEPVAGATVYEVHLRDREGLPVWVGVRGGGASEAAVPPGVWVSGGYAYVYATDSATPADRVRGALMAARAKSAGPATLTGRLVRTSLAPSTALPPGPVRESFSRTIFP